jgi:hypothetical protein
MSMRQSIRVCLVVAAFAMALAVSRFVVAAPDLAVDFGDGPVQSGFTAFNPGPSQTYGSIVVTQTGADGVFTRGAGGAYASLYGDFVYSNGGTFTIQVDGLLPSRNYDVRLYSYDSNPYNVSANETTTFTPANGTGGLATSVTYTFLSDATTADQYSTLVTWTTNGSGSLTWINSASGYVPNLTRLNGVEISLVPEPAATALLAIVAGGATLRRRRCA